MALLALTSAQVVVLVSDAISNTALGGRLIACIVQSARTPRAANTLSQTAFRQYRRVRTSHEQISVHFVDVSFVAAIFQLDRTNPDKVVVNFITLDINSDEHISTYVCLDGGDDLALPALFNQCWASPANANILNSATVVAILP